MSGGAKQSKFMKGLKRRPVKKPMPVIPSFAEQHAANLKRANEVSVQNREREAARIQKMRELDEKERLEKEECEKRKRKYAKDMRVERDIAEVLAEDDSLDVSQPTKRRVHRRPSIAEVPSFVKNLDAPEHEHRQTLQLVRMAAISIPDDISIQKTQETVIEKLDAAVLCCTSPSKGLQKLHELATHHDFPSPLHDAYGDWMSWMSPSKWIDLVSLRVSGNKGGFKSLTSNGNYNEVLVTSDKTPTDDPAKWPGFFNTGHKKIVLRMTRSDSFGNTGSGKPMYRSMSYESMVGEMATTLHAAVCGFGVPVHAAVSWPWETQPNQKVRKYGLILALERADGDMIHYQEMLASSILGVPVYNQYDKKRQLIAYNRIVEAFARKLMSRCHEMASAGLINFDIKPGNILVNWEANIEDPSVYFADYDSTYCRVPGDQVASVNIRFFVNLLLLSMHVRAYSDEAFVEPYVRIVAPVLMQLWEQIQRAIHGKTPSDIGEGSVWVNNTEIAFGHADGAFNHRKLRDIKDAGHMLSVQLRMMVFEYLFDEEDRKVPPRRAIQWPFWKKESGSTFFEPKKLRAVPQLLRFIIFYMKVVPSAWEGLLDV